MFSLQEGGVSAHFNGQIFGSCPIKESNSGIWLTKVKKKHSYKRGCVEKLPIRKRKFMNTKLITAVRLEFYVVNHLKCC